MPFRPVQWARQSIEGRQVEADGSRLLNFYAVQLAAPEESKVPVMIYSSPGQRRFLKTNGTNSAVALNTSAGVHALLEINSVVYGHWLFGISHQNIFFGIRVDEDNGGSYQIDGDYNPFKTVSPDSVYAFPTANTWQYTPEGADIVPADKPIKLVTDGRRIMWVSPNEVYSFDLKRLSDGESSPFETIQAPVPADLSTLEDLDDQDWVDCLWIDGYFLLAAKSGQFFHSNLDSTQFDQLDFAEAGSNPDNIVGIEHINRRVYIFGTESVEAWYNAGHADFAFARDNSQTLNVGCANRATIAKNQFAIVFLGNDLSVYSLIGGRPNRISTETVELAIARSDQDQARGFTYTEEGHRFYSLTLVNAEDGTKANWTYDFVTGVWHERDQTDILCHIRWNKHQNIVGREGAEHIFDLRLDWGVIEADSANATDNVIQRESIAPLLFANQQRVNMTSFQIEVPLRSGGQPTDSILVEWSDDGKRTWKGGTAQDGTTSLAHKLDDGPRFRRNRLGQFRIGRHMRLTTSARRRVDVLGAYVETDIAPD